MDALGPNPQLKILEFLGKLPSSQQQGTHSTQKPIVKTTKLETSTSKQPSATNNTIPPSLIQALRSQDIGFAYIDGLLGSDACSTLCSRVREIPPGEFEQAKMGGDSWIKWKDGNYRGDKTTWISSVWDKENTMFSPLIKRLKQIRQQLQREFRLGDKTSIQLAQYPADNGSGYTKHSDVSPHIKQDEEQRVITVLYYLNPGWQVEKNGGSLVMFKRDGTTEEISPVADRVVLFRSNMEHQVRSSSGRARWAISCWFYGTPPPSKPSKSIFVSIPSYRDPQCQHTIIDLFQKAKEKSNVFVGVCWQLDMVKDAEKCFSHLNNENAFNFNTHVRSIILPHRCAKGPTYARSIIHEQLYQGETFILNIDSHTRFRENWDEHLLTMLEQAEVISGHPRVVLTTYPSGFKLSEDNPLGLTEQVDLPNPLALQLVGPTVLRAGNTDEHDNLVRLVAKRLDEPVSEPVVSQFWAAGFNFSRAKVLSEVPYPNVQHLFFGEELLQGARLWTHGWDFYAPHIEVLHHLWSRDYRPTFQCPDAKKLEASRKVARFLAGTEPNTNWTLGQQRTLQEYELFCGVPFSSTSK
mmetsp:Transcript_12600/g.20349  ORF Transcript_12600/g.20349 Transcript_12600/m.20349 type:complete len:580 (-) Transcript_12600:1060-2799(-)|eukprot:CAMPEP_0203798276 /NCGR_PEP_ID=MMETSP0100_2-20121128/9149_1 /ASSEMBLY_ACC=CAM_ASM_000210 /TAXON_ID=96639 /ORGANISM=" , Strain NY0313808BC1" /LENGTH=579 /DNA_ID=CAMNT_0050703785 /DNA_START=130 /DNA_END=1869 /DNA_ORIENTATION=-